MVVCPYCGKEFEPTKYQLNRIAEGKKVYCSPSCGSNARYKVTEITEEVIDKIQYLMKNTSLNYTQIRKECNLTISQFEQTINKYNLKRDKDLINKLKVENCHKTMLEKYGVESAMHIESVRRKVSEHNKKYYEDNKEEILEHRRKIFTDKYGDPNYNNRKKAKQTMLEKYGVETNLQRQEVRNKITQIVLEKYGVDNALKSKELQDKAKQVRKKKYGSEYVLSVPEIRVKIKQTNLKKYGNTNAMKNKVVQDTLVKSLMDKYGVTTGYLTPNAINSHKHGTISNLNKNFKKLLELNIPNIDVKMEIGIGKYCYDLLIDNLLIDINPTISHNSTISYPYKLGMKDTNNPIPTDYHYKRYMNAIQNNYELISVFDWMDYNKVIDIIKAKLKRLDIRVFGNKCKVKEITQTEANKFLELYHLQGGASNQTVCIGLFYNNELVQVQTFGKPRYNNKVEWEAIRLASKKDTYIIGGVSKGFKYFVNKYDPSSIISYNSLNISTGYTDNMQGFKLQGYSKSQGIWVNTLKNDSPYIVRSSTLRAQGIDRVLNKPASEFPDYDGTFENSNEGLMIKNGYVKVYDCGNVTYIWNKDSN